MDLTPSEVSAYYSARVPKLKQQGREWRGSCPLHGGEDPNFVVDSKTGMAFCHSRCQRGVDVFALEMELTATDFVKAKAAVYELIGRPKPAWEDRDIQATYDYTDASGKLLYQVVRKAGKKFMQRRPGPNGKWQWGLGNVQPVPFQLPLVVKADRLAIVEGERDAINLTRAGLVATCNNGGAGNFKPELAQHFAGKSVFIFPDNDEPGRKHALSVAAVLHGIARSIKIVEIPGLSTKGDISDFLDKGGTLDKLREIAKDAQEWTPEWQYGTDVPHENDRYIRTCAQYIEETGGLDSFWAPPVGSGVPLPFTKLNDALGGMRAGEIYVLGANAGAGKTSLALQFIWHAVTNQRGVLLFSMEMGHRDVFQRMIGMLAKVDLSKFAVLQKSKATGPDIDDMRFRLRRWSWEVADKPLLVCTRSSVTTKYMIDEVKRLSTRRRMHLVVIDHMQLMSSTGTPRGDYEKFTHISRSMKVIAETLGVPLLLVSQTSRNASHDKRNELEMEDLRGSGAIEEDAGAVLLLYPDKEDSERAVREQTFHIGPVKTWLKIAKNRYGTSGTGIPLLHYKTFTMFEEYRRDGVYQ